MRKGTIKYNKTKKVVEAYKELKEYIGNVVMPMSLGELMELHPVNDDTNEATIFIDESNDIIEQVRYYHKVLEQKEYSFFSLIHLKKESSEEVKLKKLISGIKSTFILGVAVYPNFEYMANSEVAARCYRRSIKEVWELGKIDVVEDEGNWELERLIERIYILLENNWISEDGNFKNKIINEIISSKEKFDRLWKEENSSDYYLSN